MNTDKLLQLSPEDLALLNSPLGLRILFADKKTNVEKALRTARYESKLIELQTELIKLQNWVIQNDKKVVIVFEGRDAAGKGGAIRRITAYINPRYYRKVALPKPSVVFDFRDTFTDFFCQSYFQLFITIVQGLLVNAAGI